jgi:hypothetical protein
MVSSMGWYRAGSLDAEWRRQGEFCVRARQEIAVGWLAFGAVNF